MSVKAMSAAFEAGDRFDLSATDRLILLRLGDWSDDFGYSWPGLEDLASKVGIEKRSVRRRLSVLEEAGLLIRIVTGRGRGRTTLYRLLPEILSDSEEAPGRVKYFARFGKEDIPSGFNQPRKEDRPTPKRGPAEPEKRTPEAGKEDIAVSSDPLRIPKDPLRIPEGTSKTKLDPKLLERIRVPPTDRSGKPISNLDAYRRKVAESPGVIEDLEQEARAEEARSRGVSELRPISEDL